MEELYTDILPELCLLKGRRDSFYRFLPWGPIMHFLNFYFCHFQITTITYEALTMSDW